MKVPLVISGNKEYIDKIREYARKTGRQYSVLVRMALNKFIAEEATKLGIHGFQQLDDLAERKNGYR